MNEKAARERLDEIYAEQVRISDKMNGHLSPDELGDLNRQSQSLASEAQQLRIKLGKRQ